MIIERNVLGHLEVPDFILKKASGERIGILQCTAKNYTEKFNDLDVLTFEIPYMTDAQLTPFYDDIDIMKYVLVNGIGEFAIKSINIINEGQHTEYKKIECQSVECELGQKYLEEFSINQGTTGAVDGVKFYQPGDQAHSLLDLCISEKCPSWAIGHVSNALRGMQRSFEVTRQDIYSFLMNDVSEAFECIFIYDGINRTVSAYAEEEYFRDTNIHVSYNNLLEKTEMDYSIDDIKTCLTLKGDDDLDVREITMGYDRIYNFEAYASEEYWSESLLAAYRAWQALLSTTVNTSLFRYKTGVITASELSGKTYEDAFTYLLNKYQSYYTSLSEWYNTKLPYLVQTRRNPGYGTISFTEDGSDAITFDRQTSTVLVSSLPSSKDENTLYIMDNSNTYAMYRWSGTKWVNVNDWHDIALAELKTLQASAENLQAVAMKAGYGESDSSRYVDTYLPPYYMYSALSAQIDSVKTIINGLEEDQAIIEYDKNIISDKTDMKNNFSTSQLKELSTFIREDELSSTNYVVTDAMTEDEKFEMLYDLLAYGEKELAKVSSPKIQFTADLINLFAIPEFDTYSGSFDIGNYLWVTIRDDYSIKAKILEININFLDQSEFSVTFGNIMKKAKNIFTDVSKAINAATAAATSVSFGASHWSAAAKETDTIGKALADGLLSQSYYLANAEDNETLIDENGIWITTTTGQYGRENTDDYDAIYIGGGRILFTDDGWRTVSMSVGRGDVSYPQINNGEIRFVTKSMFGTYADFIIAGYVGGSTIVGGDIYSANYKTSSSKTSGNYGTHINLQDGTLEFNNSGKKRLTLNSSGTLEVNGVIQASSGHIGCNDDGEGGFIIQNSKLYNGKSSFNSTSEGVYIGTDGISLGAYSNSKNPFSVSSSGYLVSKSGNIGGWTIANSTLKSGNITLDAGNNQLNVNDKFVVYNDGSFKASNGGFEVTSSGYMTCTSGKIAGWEIGSNSLSASNITISSSGSIKQSSGGVSSWSISSDGKAVFKNISISDTAKISSNTPDPFNGTCVSHIQTISANYIDTNYLSAMRGRIGSLESDHVSVNDLNAVNGQIGDLWADHVSTNDLSAAVGRIGELESDTATIGNLVAEKVDADEVSTMILNAGYITADEITSDLIVGKLEGSDCYIEGLELHSWFRLGAYNVQWLYDPSTDLHYLGR